MLLGITAFVGFVALAVRFARGQEDALRSIDVSNWPLLSGVAAALFGVMLINGVVLRDLVAHFGVRLSVRSWLGLTLVGSLLNIVSPVRGGAALRFIYLKRVHGVALTEVATVLMGSTLCSLAVSAALGACTIAALGVPGGVYGWIALATSVLMATVLIVGLWFPPPQVKMSGIVLARFTRVVEAWRSLGNQPALLSRVFAWNILAACLHAVAFYLAFCLTSFQESWLVPATSSAFARMGTLLAITPAGLGIFEAFGVVSAAIVGADAGAALIGVLVVRIVGAIVGIAGGLVMLPMLMRSEVNVAKGESPAIRDAGS